MFFHSSTENGNNDRRARVEKITINADGSIDQVENTSLGFQDYLDVTYETAGTPAPSVTTTQTTQTPTSTAMALSASMIWF